MTPRRFACIGAGMRRRSGPRVSSLVAIWIATQLFAPLSVIALSGGSHQLRLGEEPGTFVLSHGGAPAAPHRHGALDAFLTPGHEETSRHDDHVVRVLEPDRAKCPDAGNVAAELGVVASVPSPIVPRSAVVRATTPAACPVFLPASRSIPLLL